MRLNGGTIALAMLLATASLAQTGSIEIVDGDTVQVGGVSWRFPGYDTPETYYAQCDAERQAGALAAKGLEALSAGAAR
jgi:micrococcal nuclease